MNQGKLEVVKQEMERVNIDILGISELKWTGMGKFNSDDHYMATHSSVLAWRIPWMEELGGLQSMHRKESDTTEQLHFPSTEFQTLLLTMMAIPFLLRDSCPQ